MQTAQLALLSSTLLQFLLIFVLSVSASPLEPPRRLKLSQTNSSVHVPIFRRELRSRVQRRAGLTGSIGLGDFFDVTYSFLVTVGGIETPLVLDTGSSDLWVASDACTTCETKLPLFPQATVTKTGMDVDLLYGDSLTGTHASGIIAQDRVTFAGITIPNQYFAAINDTNTNVLDTGSAGIFGLGFALNSVLWNEIFADKFSASQSSSSGRRSFPRRLSPSNYGTRFFPDLAGLVSSGSRKRTTSEELTAAVLQSYPSEGPALTRMVTTNSLVAPMFTIALQRDILDIGGNAGMLTLGELPGGVQPSSLTWVPLRGYPGALNAPADSPNESYPIAWEIFVDGVFLDGVPLPRSNLSSPNIKVSALIDTGNSLLRGPADVVNEISNRLGTTFACSTPHTLAFSIGGKLFPVDPRDFVSQAADGELSECVANVVETDAPVEGKGYQYSWSLGDPFIKGVLAAFYYGNITYPSHDPPSIGLLSTVPEDAGVQLQEAIASAIAVNGANEFSTMDAAPTGVPAAVGTGVPLAGKLGNGNADENTNGAERVRRLPVGGWLWILAIPALGSLVGLV